MPSSSWWKLWGIRPKKARRPDLQKAFQSHQAQTEKQVERLRQVFDEIGEEPEEVECKGIRGLIEEHDHFKEEAEPAQDIMDIFNAGAAEKVESYEICAYESLIRMADTMGHTKASKLLNQNLKEEQQTLKKMQAFSKKLKPENVGMEDEEEESDTGMMEDESSQRRNSSRKQSASSSRRSGGRHAA